MATISENLSKLAEAKENIKTAIEAKGQDLTNVPFVEYATKIESIEIGEKKRTLYLPDAFLSVKKIYTFAVSDNIVLISADTPSNIGIWECDLSTNECVQLTNQSYNYQYFQMIGNDCLVGSPTSYWVLYDASARTVSVLSSGSTYSYLYLINGYVFLSGSGIAIYKPEEKKITKIVNMGGGELVVTQIKDRVLFGSKTGVYLYIYDFNTQKTNSYLGSSNNWVNHIVIGDNALISNGATGTGKNGIYLYDYEAETCEQIYDQSYNWKYGYDMGNGSGLLAGSTTNTGLLYYDGETKTIMQVYETGGYWSAFQDVGEDILIGSTINSSYCRGILTFSKTTKEASVLFSDSSSFGYFYLLEDVCLISSMSGAGSMGVAVYDIATKTVSRAISGGASFEYFCELDNVVLMSGNTTTYTRLYEYDKHTREIVNLTNFPARFDTFIVSDKVEVSSSKDNCALTYDPETRTISDFRISIEV